MTATNEFEKRRFENIKRNNDLLESLGVTTQAKVLRNSVDEPAKKESKIEKQKHNAKTRLSTRPIRTSARIANAPAPSYHEDTLANAAATDLGALTKSTSKSRGTSSAAKITKSAQPSKQKKKKNINERSAKELKDLQASWSAWIPSAPPPTRDEDGVLHFASHPTFTPNKTPEEVLREGCFGGSYFRPLYSKHLDLTIRDDYLELPASWRGNLDVGRYLVSPIYNPEINKYKVPCGQSIEQWEEAGWIDHRYDVRGWFQWYCRFFVGRRCEDDERQVGRWRKCVGERGRWRGMLLKRYGRAGVKEVWDDGSEEREEREEVSPVMHQTCHHWGFCVTQEVLDGFWREGR